MDPTIWETMFFPKHFLSQIQGKSKIFKKHLSYEKRARGCLGFTGDEMFLPSYMGIISQTLKYKDPY